MSQPQKMLDALLKGARVSRLNCHLHGIAPENSSVHLRQTFEKFISAPPFEKPIDRRPGSSAWPGNYADINVSLAWHAFCEGYRLCLEKAASEKS